MKKIYVLLLAFIPLKIFGQCSISVSASSDTICVNMLDTLFANSTSVHLSDTASYTWTYRDSVLSTTIGGSGYSSAVIFPEQTMQVNVTVRYGSGCVASDSITIFAESINPAVFASSKTCGSKDTLLIKGVAGQSLQWYNDGVTIPSATDSTYIANSSGEYTVITKKGVCSVTYGPAYYSPSSDPLTITINQSIDTALYISVNADSIRWYRNGQLIPDADGETYGAGTTGNYSAKAYSNGCTILSDTVSVTVAPLPVITSSGTISCNGFDTLRVQSAGSGNMYYWFYNGQYTGFSSTDTFYVARYSGSYTVTDSLVGGEPHTSNTYEVTGLPWPTGISYTGFGCSSDSAVLSLPYFNSATYQWSKNGTLLSGQNGYGIDITSPGSYSATVSFSNGCSYTKDTTISTITNNFSVSITADSALCQAGFDSLYANVNGYTGGSITYTWTKSDSGGVFNFYNNNLLTVYVGQTSTYKVTVNINNQCYASDSITIKVGGIITSPTFSTTGCSVGDTFSINGDPGGMTYQWNKDGSSTGVTTSSYAAMYPGVYTANAYYGGCSYSFGPVYYSPASNPLPLTIDQGYVGDTLLSVTYGLNSYQWYRNGQVITGATMFNYNVDSSGSYSVNATSYGCTLLSDTITINELPKPAIIASPITSCNGVDTLKTYSIGSGATYFWYFNGDPVATTTDTLYVAHYSGSYQVTDSVGNSISSISDTYVVEGLPLPSNELNVYYINSWGLCQGDSAPAHVPYFNSAAYQWYKNDTAVSGATNNNFSIFSAGDYSVIINFAGGCSDTLNTTVIQSGAITASLSRNAVGDSLVVTVVGGIAPYNYTPRWAYYQGFEGNEMYIDSAGSYSVYVNDSNGCSAITNTVVVYNDSVGGRVFDSSGVPAVGILMQLLVKNADSTAMAIASTYTSNGGFYSFNTIASNGYILATPPVDSTQYLPTYFQSSITIQSAILVNFDSDPINDTIVLANATQSSGSGEISGTIDSSSLSGSRKGIVFRTDSAGSSPIAGLKIILLNANNQPVATTYTDANGNFQFTGLANGTYKLWVDGYGINNANAPSVTVNSSSSSISNNLQFAVSGNTLERVSSVTGTTAATLSNAISVYPNPTNSSFTVSVSGQFGSFTYTLTDQQGRDITTGQGTSTVNTSGLEPGLYIVRVQTAEAVAYQKLIIER